MNGWRIGDNGILVATSDPDAMASSMPTIKNYIARRASSLDATLDPAEFERQLASYNQALGCWNDNVALLEQNRVLGQVREITASLRWPPDEEASEASVDL